MAKIGRWRFLLDLLQAADSAFPDSVMEERAVMGKCDRKHFSFGNAIVFFFSPFLFSSKLDPTLSS